MLKTNIFLTFSSICLFLPYGVPGVASEAVIVIEGHSVTLKTEDKINLQEKTLWYFNDDRLYQTGGNQTKICTDDRCKERFRDRLKVDHQTGSLTITNTRSTDSGLYKVFNLGSSGITNEKTFNVTVYGVSAAERVEIKTVSVKEGESVTLDPGGINASDSVKWYFNKTLITEITGDQSQICTEGQCKERFRDRLKVDHQTGSLTITNTKTTDSGEYEFEIISFGSSQRHRRSVSIRVKSFSVDVTAAGSSLAAVVGCVSVAVLILLVVLGGIYYHKHQKCKNGENQMI